MLKNLIKWLFECQKASDKFENKLAAIGIICEFKCEENCFLNYYNAINIILENVDLPEDFDEERMFEDFIYGTDFDAFWSKYGEVFEQ